MSARSGAITASAGIAALAGLVAYDRLGGHLTELVRDPTTLGGLPSHYGLLASLGLVAWGAAATAFLGSGLALREARPARARFLLWGAVVLAFLLLDDALRLHDHVVPVDLGVPERVVELAYAVGIAAFGWHFRSEVLRRDAALLLSAVGGVVLSVVVDGLELGSSGTEDLPKYAGLALLVAFAVREIARVPEHVSQPRA